MKGIKRKSNSAMTRLLAKRRPQRVRLTKELLHYLKGGVVERKGCVLLKAMKSSSRNPVIRPGDDETGYECFENHIHIIPKGLRVTSPLDLAVGYADQLALMLQASRLRGPFRIIVGYEPKHRTSTVRFHRLRQGQVWLLEDLESYKEEAVLTIDC